MSVWRLLLVDIITKCWTIEATGIGAGLEILNAIAGSDTDGTIALEEIPLGISRSKVIVTFLTEYEGMVQPPCLSLGMVSGAQIATTKDFEMADLYGICADDPIVLDDLGILNEMDSDE